MQDGFNIGIALYLYTQRANDNGESGLSLMAGIDPLAGTPDGLIG